MLQPVLTASQPVYTRLPFFVQYIIPLVAVETGDHLASTGDFVGRASIETAADNWGNLEGPSSKHSMIMPRAIRRAGGVVGFLRLPQLVEATADRVCNVACDRIYGALGLLAGGDAVKVGAGTSFEEDLKAVLDAQGLPANILRAESSDMNGMAWAPRTSEELKASLHTSKLKNLQGSGPGAVIRGAELASETSILVIRRARQETRERLVSWMSSTVQDACTESCAMNGQPAKNRLALLDDEGRPELLVPGHAGGFQMWHKTGRARAGFVLSGSVEGDEAKMWHIGLTRSECQDQPCHAQLPSLHDDRCHAGDFSASSTDTSAWTRTSIISSRLVGGWTGRWRASHINLDHCLAISDGKFGGGRGATLAHRRGT